jgi:hypothetical protein
VTAIPELDAFKYKASSANNSSVSHVINLAQNKSSAAQNGKLDDSMASEGSAKPTKMTISGTDN